ncbi:hypothetical protein GPECTOR_45g110 [Gonium pectorale]|uniref:Uncharacterized protein n=1 Tax=Gonium pectorale TaxID=33097 RepID=A0A150GA65_GONPE|nr:hypothetical protein GPECTOR_45g110 [Gonium pectorale]|eukprot:KXZ46240.1 hypothetical protein GPECTOR_45g110 [Gonium pectorale]
MTDEEWSKVLTDVGQMAATKRGATTAGGRQDAFEFMPIHMERAGLTRERVESLNVIHVAGTKGKGSTCAMVESILRACGYRTGLFTSPHLVDVRERIRLDGRMIPRAEFAASFRRVRERLASAVAAEGEGGVGMPAFFPFMTLMALDAFLARPTCLVPHVVVLEVGIGGRLDATNGVVTRGSLAAAAVTSLGFDHMEILGDTLPAIAREKAGIMKAGRPVFAAPQPQDAMQALEEVAGRVGAQLTVPPPLERYGLADLGSSPHSRAHTQPSSSSAPQPGAAGGQAPRPDGLPPLVGLGGEHMRVNASLAVALASEWEAQYAAAMAARGDSGGGGGGDLAAADVAAAAGRPVIPDEEAAARGGRLTLYLDGAHSPESMATCAAWFGDQLAAAQAAEAQAEAAEAAGSRTPGAGPRRHAAVLLFNCMPPRDPGLLLPALADALAAARLLPAGSRRDGAAQGGGAAAASGGNAAVAELAAAIFTPVLSGSTTLLPVAATSASAAAGGSAGQQPVQPAPPGHAPAAAAPGPSLSWQERMCGIWSGLVRPAPTHGRAEEHATPPSDDDSGALPGLPAASVAPSLPAALEAVRAAAAADPRVAVHVLVTGSLYLVGDTLRLLNKPPL